MGLSLRGRSWLLFWRTTMQQFLQWQPLAEATLLKQKCRPVVALKPPCPFICDASRQGQNCSSSFGLRPLNKTRQALRRRSQARVPSAGCLCRAPMRSQGAITPTMPWAPGPNGNRSGLKETMACACCKPNPRGSSGRFKLLRLVGCLGQESPTFRPCDPQRHREL